MDNGGQWGHPFYFSIFSLLKRDCQNSVTQHLFLNFVNL
ncbi:hypothetical protein D1AOALGA4SA_3202 [Olavius algarvensis Delta 1 endosymbiont]|nr:hypothetical protein D1AOALGA4SA_3202 [Olavius algarvensis Delta 1 endosymbiont]